jgi:hypothetical protein
MNVKTKNYSLEKKAYISLAFKRVMKQQGWIAALAAFVICLGYIWVASIWWFIAAFIGVLLYMLFWYIQFYAVTQMEQSKMLFQKFFYEINSKDILMKINAREGMPIKWDQIQKADIGKDFFVLYINRAQLLYWPFRIFNTENERKFVASILKAKGLVK